jgi:predicted PurR-regulated permease PerM
MAMLMQDWVGAVGMLLILFRFPIYFVTFFLSLGAAYWFTPNIQTLARDGKKNNKYLTLTLYSLFAILLLAYMQLGEVLFS